MNPSRLGPFDEVREVARGGQGVVYRARQVETGRNVALKRLHALGDDPEEARRWLTNELEATALLAHEGLVKVYGVEATEIGPVLWMEWVDGLPIDAWSDGRPAREILVAFAALCDAVHYAHGRGVVHRDLKPSNVLVGADGRPRVLDFGLATAPVAAGAASQAVFAGTPAFAPPEVLRDGASTSDVLGDVYSLGAILYALLGGSRTPSANAAKARPARLAGQRRDVDRELDLVLQKALAPARAERYASVAALGSDVRRWLAGLPLGAHPPSTWYELRKLVLANRAASLLCAVLVGVLGAFAGLELAHARALERERGAALAAAEDARRAEELARGASELAQGEALLAVAALADAQRAREEAEVERELARGAARAAAEARDAADRAARETEDVVTVLIDTVLSTSIALNASAARFDLAQLDLVAGRIEDAFAERRDLAAELCRRMSFAYALAGRYQDSAALAQRTADLVGLEYPGETVQRQSALEDLGVALMRTRRHADALAVIEESLALVRSLGLDRKLEIKLLAASSKCLADLGRHAEAEPLARAAWEIAQAESQDPSFLFTSQMDLILFLRSAGKHAESVELARDAYPRALQLLGPASIEAAALARQLGEDEMRRGDYARALEYMQPAVEVMRRHYPREHGTRVTASVRLAQIDLKLGDYGGVLAALADIQDVLFRAEDVALARIRCTGLWIACCAFDKLARYPEGVAPGRASRALALELYGAGSEEELRVLEPLIQCLAGSELADEGREILAQVTAALATRKAPSAERQALDLARIGTSYLMLGDLELADAWLGPSLAAIRALPELPWEYDVTFRNAIETKQRLGDTSAAEALRAELARLSAAE